MSDHPQVLIKEEEFGLTAEEIKYLNTHRAAITQPLTREQSELQALLVKAAVRRALWNVFAALVTIVGFTVSLYYGEESTIGSLGMLVAISGAGIYLLLGREPA